MKIPRNLGRKGYEPVRENVDAEALVRPSSRSLWVMF